MEAPFFWEPLGPDRVAKIRWRAGAVVTGDLARTTLVELAALIPRGTQVPVLADIRPLKSMTREARACYGQAVDAVSAVALLADSPATRMLANFFLGINRPTVPTQMFTDEQKALTWLRRYTA
jgi:hypothetical protein